jgi:hypothetical protein
LAAACKERREVDVPSKTMAPFFKPRNVFEAVAISGQDLDWAPEADARPSPCQALPGSAAKVDVLCERVRKGTQLWHPEDASYA